MFLGEPKKKKDFSFLFHALWKENISQGRFLTTFSVVSPEKKKEKINYFKKIPEQLGLNSPQQDQPGIQ
jgi:hypothetical protein